MEPTGQDVHVDAAMTQISLAYHNRNYRYEEIFPEVSLDHRSDYYYIFTKGDWFRDEAGPKGPGARARRGGFTLSTTAIYARKWAFASELAWDDRDNADDVLRLETSKTLYATDRVLLRLERVAAAAIFAASVWTTELTVGTDFTAWDTYASSDPIGNVDSWKDTVHGLTGMTPNVLLIGRQVWTKLKNHPDVLGRMANTGTKIPTREIVAEMMELDRILVCDPIYNTAAEGATASYSFIWGKNALLYYVPNAPGKEIPSAGYNFTWQTRKVRSWSEVPEEQDVYECQQAAEPTVTGADLGAYAASCVS